MLRDLLKIKVKYLRDLIKAYREAEMLTIKKKKQAYVMLAANYDNLGDIAITKAQEEFLKKNLPEDYEIITVPFDKTYQSYLFIKKHANDDTIITLIGGGNSGTLYEFIEEPRRFILRYLKKYKIVSFPQSVKYENKIYQREFIRLCEKCDKLTLVARERISYNFYKKILKDKVEILLTPDIVFTLEGNNVNKRSGVTFIFRNDKEKSLDNKKEQNIISQCKKCIGESSFDDTCDVSIIGNGYAELKEFCSRISSRELVITDRLHGMILSYVEGTPCIVFDNNNHKISSTYETWLKGQSLIIMYNDIQNVEKFILEKKEGEKKDLTKNFIGLTKSLLR